MKSTISCSFYSLLAWSIILIKHEDSVKVSAALHLERAPACCFPLLFFILRPRSSEYFGRLAIVCIIVKGGLPCKKSAVRLRMREWIYAFESQSPGSFKQCHVWKSYLG